MPKILDTHIHLWPSTAVASTSHGWMTPDHLLAKRHGIDDYLSVTRETPPEDAQPAGFIHVETDRYLPSPSPHISAEDSSPVNSQRLREWAKEPLEELRFLRRITEGTPNEGDGFTARNAGLMVGCVIWAPFHLSHELFTLYLRIAEEVAGPQLWREKVVGFRYLLQAIKEEQTMRGLVESEDWLQNMLYLRQGREGKGWAFDIGVDTHSGGVWQLGVVADMVDRVRETERGDPRGNVRFIINHLAKPSLTPSPAWPDFPLWQTYLARLAAHPAIYMKLSGAFNEFAGPTPTDVPSLVLALRPFATHIFTSFKGRVMFGSDWPVCNLGGPMGEMANWKLWRDVLEAVIGEIETGARKGEDEGERVWWRAGCEGYGVVL